MYGRLFELDSYQNACLCKGPEPQCRRAIIADHKGIILDETGQKRPQNWSKDHKTDQKRPQNRSEETTKQVKEDQKTGQWRPQNRSRVTPWLPRQVWIVSYACFVPPMSLALASIHHWTGRKCKAPKITSWVSCPNNHYRVKCVSRVYRTLTCKLHSLSLQILSCVHSSVSVTIVILNY